MGSNHSTFFSGGIHQEKHLNSENGIIDTIFFDLDGTLLHNKPSSNQFFFERAVELGLSDSQDGRLKALRWAHRYWASSPELRDDQESFGEGSEFWFHYARKYLEAFGCSPEEAEQLGPKVQQAMLDDFEPQVWISPDTPDVLRTLQNEGFSLALITNRRDPVHEELEELGLSSFFEYVLAAGEVDFWKPDARIFRHATQELGTTPERSIYIGDNYYADIIGARSAGMQAVLFDTQGTFPDADCPKVASLKEIPQMLQREQS